MELTKDAKDLVEKVVTQGTIRTRNSCFEGIPKGIHKDLNKKAIFFYSYHWGNDAHYVKKYSLA